MVNNQTSLKLNKLQQKQVSYIVKENGMYEVGTEADWALQGQTTVKQFKTLVEVKEAIVNIIPFLTNKESNDFKRKQQIRSITDDYNWAKRTNDLEGMKIAEKELKELGLTLKDIEIK